MIMGATQTKQKIYAALLALCAGILLFRTIRLLTVENGWELANWVIVLTFVEMIIDISCIIYSLKWLVSNSNRSKSRALRLGAAAALVHAFRVLIYALGRTATFHNFDVKPQFRTTHHVDMLWVYFAATLSVLGILGVIIIWIVIQKHRHDRKV